LNLLKMLKQKGFSFKPGKDMTWPETVIKRKKVKVEATVRIDRIIYRGISKIAFNYLAKVAGKEFTLSDDFDGIRNFIRYDEGGSNNYFVPNQPPILHDDKMLQKYGIKTTQGHLLIVGWKGSALISKVSIFNQYTYLVILCKNYRGMWFRLSSGHHFDVSSKDVNELISISKRLII